MNPLRTVPAAFVAAALGCVAATAASLDPLPDAASIAVDAVTSRAYVVERDLGLLSIVDLDTRTLVTAVPAGVQPRRIVHDAVRGRAYVVDAGTPAALHVVDTLTGRLVASVALGDGADAIAADLPRGEVYVANRDAGTVTVIGTAGNATLATLAVGGAPASLAVGAASGRLYVADAAGARLIVIDQASRALIAEVAVGRSPASVAVDEATGHAYVNAAGDDVIDVIDTATARVIAALPTGRGSTAGVVASAYGRYYLPNRADGTLTVVDTARSAVVDVVPVGGAPGEVVVDAGHGVVYVAHADGDGTAVIDAASDRLLHVLPGPAAALAVEPAHGALLVLDGGAGAAALRVAAMAPPLQDTALAIEYHAAASDQYFHTASAVEHTLIDDGAYGPAWRRTQAYWRVWTAPAPGRVPVCRLYAAHAGAAAAHLWSPYGEECGVAAKSAREGWTYEGIAYFVAMPSRDGRCTPDTVPLYRLYNGGRGGAPNHRYTADRSIRDAMLAQGWSAEGAGADAVFACTPPVAAAPAADREPEPGLLREPLASPPGNGDGDSAQGPPSSMRIPLLPRPR